MNKNSGYIVETKSGKIGRTFHNKGFVNNKQPVYLEISKDKYSETALLCEPSTLKIIGFIDIITL